VTGHLTAVAGSCGPGSLHFINGIFEANRNRAPVVLIASPEFLSAWGSDRYDETFVSSTAACGAKRTFLCGLAWVT